MLGSTLAAILLLPFIYSPPLHKASLKTIPQMQTDLPQWVMDFTSVFSETMDPTEYGIVFLLCTSIGQKYRLFSYSLVLTTTIFLKNVLKFAYGASRPYWLDSSITLGASQCSLDYAMPSGHSSEVGAVGAFLFLELVAYWKKE